MKKLLSIFAAVALVFGLASCSGDLHDDELSSTDAKNYGLVGTMQGWNENAPLPFVEEDTYSYSVNFTATSATNEQISFIPNAGSWDGQIGGDKISAGSFPTGITYEAKDNGYGGKNGVISGLTVGSTYTLKIDTSSGFVVSIELPESTLILTGGTSNGLKANTKIIITGLGALKGGTINGSLFGWCGGSKVEFTEDKAEYTVEINATDALPGWIAEQQPYGDAYPTYPTTADAAAKLNIAGEEAWICFVNGGTYTFNWANRK